MLVAREGEEGIKGLWKCDLKGCTNTLSVLLLGSVSPWLIRSGVRIRGSVFFWRAKKYYSAALDIQADIWYTVLKGGMTAWRGRTQRGEWEWRTPSVEYGRS